MNRPAWKRLLIGLCPAVCSIAAALGGCGGSSDPIEIPEAARKTLFKKKADYEHRSTKATRAGASKPKVPTASPRP